MPTESGDSRDVNEGDDTEETGGLSIKQNSHMENVAAYSVRNSEKAKAVFEHMKTKTTTDVDASAADARAQQMEVARYLIRKTEKYGLSAFFKDVPITSDLSFEEIANNIYSGRHRFSEVSKLKEKESM